MIATHLIYLVTIAVLVIALGLTTWRLVNARLRIADLETAYPSRKQAFEQRQRELAMVYALREQIRETELFTRLSLELGWVLSDDDTLPVID